MWHRNEVIKMVRKKLGLEVLELTRTNPVIMFPWSSEVVSKTKQLSSPTRKKKCQNSTIPPGFPWVPQGCSRGLPTAMRMVSVLVLQSLAIIVEATRNLKKKARIQYPFHSISYAFDIHERKILVFFGAESTTLVYVLDWWRIRSKSVFA